MDEDGPVTEEDSDLFSVMSYSLSGDDLEVRSLNTELVNTELADTRAMQKAFHKHRMNTELFIEPGRMRRL